VESPGVQLIFGVFESNRKFDFRYLFHMPGHNVGAKVRAKAFKIQARDLSGRVLSEAPVFPRLDPAKPTFEQVCGMTLADHVDLPEGTSSVRLIRGAKVIGKLVCSAVRPTVTVGPLDYSEDGNAVRIPFAIQDTDTDEHGCIIHYFPNSNTNEPTRLSVARKVRDGDLAPLYPRPHGRKDSRIKETGRGFIVFDTRKLEDGSFNKFRFAVSDGLNTTFAWSDKICVKGGRNIEIKVLADGSYVTDGRSFDLNGLVDWLKPQRIVFVRLRFQTSREVSREKREEALDALRALNIGGMSIGHFLDEAKVGKRPREH